MRVGKGAVLASVRENVDAVYLESSGIFVPVRPFVGHGRAAEVLV